MPTGEFEGGDGVVFNAFFVVGFRGRHLERVERTIDEKTGGIEIR